MRVGLLITSIGNFGQKGFYNTQEIGLAKELNKTVDEVVVYKLVPTDQKARNEKIANSQTVTLHMIPARSFGINGFFDVSILDTTLDAVIYFSDTQMIVPRVAKWAKKNRVALYPYIGVLESHSINAAKKKIIDLLFKRNLSVYRNLHCFVKTPDVERCLRAYGVEKITVIPVGLDISLLHSNYERISKNVLKDKYGYQENEKVLLFIGRFVQEKQPERMIDIFKAVYEEDNNYRLLMVGIGELWESVENKVEKFGLTKQVRFISKIPNSDIWKLYRLAEAFINLNQQEIFGMAILEAMYYGCKVVAWRAPGPELIIENGKSGWLTTNNEDVIEKIMDPTDLRAAAHERILLEFTWESSAKKMLSVIGERK